MTGSYIDYQRLPLQATGNAFETFPGSGTNSHRHMPLKITSCSEFQVILSLQSVFVVG